MGLSVSAPPGSAAAPAGAAPRGRGRLCLLGVHLGAGGEGARPVGGLGDARVVCGEVCAQDVQAPLRPPAPVRVGASAQRHAGRGVVARGAAAGERDLLVLDCE